MFSRNLSSFKTSMINSQAYQAQTSEVRFKLDWRLEITLYPLIRETEVPWVLLVRTLGPIRGPILGTRIALKHRLLYLWMILRPFRPLAHLVGNVDLNITVIDLGMDTPTLRKKSHPSWRMSCACHHRLLLASNEGMRQAEESEHTEVPRVRRPGKFQNLSTFRGWRQAPELINSI